LDLTFCHPPFFSSADSTQLFRRDQSGTGALH
jgi:hypothetical protein